MLSAGSAMMRVHNAAPPVGRQRRTQNSWVAHLRLFWPHLPFGWALAIARSFAGTAGWRHDATRTYFENMTLTRHGILSVDFSVSMEMRFAGASKWRMRMKKNRLTTLLLRH